MKTNDDCVWELFPKVDKKSKKNLAVYPDIVKQILFNRGVSSAEDARLFLENIDFISESKIYNVEKAASEILEAVDESKKIVIHGDFDVDGICATSILWDFLYRKLGADCLPYVPSRFEEGYGMTDESLKAVKKLGAQMVVTVDCGIKDNELIKKWKKKGLEFIVTDHHELKKKDGEVLLPNEACAVVHPRYPGNEYKYPQLAGANVAWKLVNQISEQKGISLEKDEYLDLVALATVCDIMPLAGENRLIVKRGLEKIRQTTRVGLRRLIYDGGVKPEEVQTYHLGFVIGPRLNASGRLDHALDAIRLLSTNSKKQARNLSEKLNRLNLKRRSIQEEIYKSALSQIEEQTGTRKLYFVWGDDWAEGVIGIVAGKICEKFNRPVLVATKKGDGFTGSARSIQAFNIIEAIRKHAELLERFGGHPQAAGFTVKENKIEQFRDALFDYAEANLTDGDLNKIIKVDCEVNVDDINWELFKWIDKFSPFGYGNTKPKFVLRKCKLSYTDLVGEEKKHLRLSVLNTSNGEFLSGIGFNLGYKKLKAGDEVDILFCLDQNEWNGQTKLQMNIKDLKKVT